MDEKTHILIVDDEQEICALVHQYLSGEGYQVSVAHDGGEMRQVIERSTVDLVILDIVLPTEDGLTLARTLRAERQDIGIIMLTGRGDTIDRIVGLEIGADDYLAKPFHLRELLARVKSVVRRTAVQPVEAPAAGDTSRVRFAGWLLDLHTRELRSPVGSSIKLTAGEYDLLRVFVTNANQLLTRDKLLDLTRGREAGPFDRTIDVQVGRLRRKLDDNPQQPQLIKTLRSGGYIFVAPVEAVAERAATRAAQPPARRLSP
ncbi:MAG TPA: response regulator [Stellaceae bacterium]|jgi:two-component system OmpR family response regulator|nr:response regulator [Stellaceae bacterium]